MNKATIALIVACLAIVIAGVAYFGIGKNVKLFGSTACSGITCLSGGLRLVTDAGGDFESDVAAVFASTAQFTGRITANGGVTVTTSNTATSTTSVGCIQTTATSTATPIRFVIGSVQAATSTFQGTNANFTVLAQYGTCPA